MSSFFSLFKSSPSSSTSQVEPSPTSIPEKAGSMPKTDKNIQQLYADVLKEIQETEQKLDELINRRRGLENEMNSLPIQAEGSQQKRKIEGGDQRNFSPVEAEGSQKKRKIEGVDPNSADPSIKEIVQAYLAPPFDISLIECEAQPFLNALPEAIPENGCRKAKNVDSNALLAVSRKLNLSNTWDQRAGYDALVRYLVATGAIVDQMSPFRRCNGMYHLVTEGPLSTPNEPNESLAEKNKQAVSYMKTFNFPDSDFSGETNMDIRAIYELIKKEYFNRGFTGKFSDDPLRYQSTIKGAEGTKINLGDREALGPITKLKEKGLIAGVCSSRGGLNIAVTEKQKKALSGFFS